MLEPIHDQVIKEKQLKNIKVDEAINMFKEAGIQKLRPPELDINIAK